MLQKHTIYVYVHKILSAEATYFRNNVHAVRSLFHVALYIYIYVPEGSWFGVGGRY